jgi:hypothetical protein
MTLSRLITWMAGISEIAIRALPPFERLRLAHECRRLLRAADPPVLPPRAPPVDATPRRPRSGVLADLADGNRAH